MHQSHVKTYVEIVKARTVSVSENAIKTLNTDMEPEALMKNIKATPVANTQMIKINAFAKSAVDAKKVANAVR